MRGSNIKLLSDIERKELKARYYFELEGDCVITRLHGYSRATAHSAQEKFSILTPIRKVTFTPTAVQYWSNLGTSNYHLLDVQQAVNMLIITYQPMSIESVKKILDNNLNFN